MNQKNMTALLGGIGVLLISMIGWLIFSDQDGNVGEDSRQQTLDLAQLSPAELESHVADMQVSYEDVYKDYKETLRFPPNSRPLEMTQYDLTSPFQLEEPFEKILHVKDGKGEFTSHVCRLQPVRNQVYEKEVAEARLSCRMGKTSVPVVVDEAVFHLVREPKFLRLPSPEILQNPDSNEVVIRYNPRKQDWGEISLEVDFNIPGEDYGKMNKKTAFFFSPENPARFVSVINDEVHNGSLLISVELMVKRPGRYMIEGNLHNEDDDTVGYAYKRVRFEEAGRQIVKLNFFGKIFHEKSSHGPYVLKNLRGYQNTDFDPALLHLPPAEVEKRLAAIHGKPALPKRRGMVPYGKNYRTASYKIDDFSRADYDSPEKRERLAYLRKKAGL